MLVTFVGTAIHRMREEIQRDQFEILEEIAQAVSVSVRLTVAPYAERVVHPSTSKGYKPEALRPRCRPSASLKTRDTLRYELLLGVEGA